MRKLLIIVAFELLAFSIQAQTVREEIRNNIHC